MMRSGKGNVPTLAGWAVTALLGAGVFILLKNSVGYHSLSSAGFGLAAALLLLLLLTGSEEMKEPEVDARVRKIVPQYEPIRPREENLIQPRRVVAAPVEEPVAELPAEPMVAAVIEETATPAGAGRLSAPRGDKADDLKLMEGVGPALEKLLNSLGIFHFDQIADWSDADVAAVDAEMAKFKGRIARDRWVAQARIIVTEGHDAFRARVKAGDY